jgi:hypothetical protein
VSAIRGGRITEAIEAMNNEVDKDILAQNPNFLFRMHKQQVL